MVLRTHNLTSGRHKKRLFEVDEVMIQGVKRPWELFFCFLGIENSELVEVA
jgi:hypothetical protein